MSRIVDGKMLVQCSRCFGRGYQPEYRARGGEPVRERANRDGRASVRALWRLAARYPDEFRAMKMQELEADR